MGVGDVGRSFVYVQVQESLGEISFGLQQVYTNFPFGMCAT